MSSFARSLWKTVLLCGFCAGTRQILLAQAASSPSDSNLARYSLRGVVINSLTGQPVPYSLVQVVSTTPHLATFTDVNGQFEFARLAGGRQFVEAHKPGFETADRHGDPLAVELNADTSPVQINLFPLAIITGRVVDERGDPLEGMSIKVTRLKVRNGRQSLMALANANTDDEGNFRIPDLMPGKYFIAINGGSMEPKRSTGSGEAYPPRLYYGGGIDRSSASPVEVKVGERVELGLVFKPVPTFEISGEMKGFSENSRLKVTDRSGDVVSLPTLIHGPNTSFTIQDVPAGSYTIMASSTDAEAGNLIAETTVEVANNVRGIELIGQRGASIPVIVHAEVQAELTPAGHEYKRWVNGLPVSIVLQPASGEGEGTSGPRIGADGKTLLLNNVKPGTYSVLAQATSGYVQSATCGSTDLLRENLVITPGEAVPPIEVVVANDTGSLTVKRSPGQPGEEPVVMVVADTVPRRPALPIYMSELEVTVELAPGHYKVLAFDSLDPNEYNRPELADQYGSKAIDVTIAPNSHTTITPYVILAEEE